MTKSSQFDLEFNPKVIEIKDVYEGTLLKSDGGQTFWVEPVIDNINGVVSISCARTTPGGVSGEGILAEVIFRIKGFGESAIEFGQLELSDSKAGRILAEAVSGSVTIIKAYPDWDANQDGKVDIFDLVIVGKDFGGTGEGDVNSDGKVDIFDLVLVGQRFGEQYEEITAAPIAKLDWRRQNINYSQYLSLLQMLYAELEKIQNKGPDFEKTRRLLQELIEIAGGKIKPDESVLCQNFPNPFNPDTWIPYQLEEDADVVVRIYNTTGQLARTLNLGHKPAGFYTDKEKAAHWDGKNEAGEHVASGVYFYHLQASSFSATKKMLIVK